MPEGLLEGLKPEQVMNLFTYLQGEGPPAPGVTAAPAPRP
jgi:hypothetical protein